MMKKFDKIKASKRVKNIVNLIITGAVLASIALYIFKNISSADLTQIKFNTLYFTTSIILLVICYLWLAYTWNYLIQILSHKKLKKYKISKIFYTSLLMRYIPGKALLVLSRVYLNKKLGISKKATLIGVFLELSISTLAAILLFGVSILFLKLP